MMAEADRWPGIENRAAATFDGSMLMARMSRLDLADRQEVA